MISGFIVAATVLSLLFRFFGWVGAHIERREQQQDAQQVIASGSRDPRAKMMTYKQGRLIERLLATGIVILILLIIYISV